MGNVKIGNMEISIGDLVLFVGGLLMLISIFLTWTVIDPAVGSNTNVSGMNLISGKIDDTSAAISFLGKAPLFMLIFGIIAMILAALPLFKVDVPALKIVGAVAALIGLIFAILYLTVGGGAGLYTGSDKDAAEAAIKLALIKMSLGFGAYFALIASIVATVGGALNVIPMFKK